MNTLPISVGSIARAKKPTAVCDVHELAVCYEIYTIGNRPGFSFIFQHGRHCGFSPSEIPIFLDLLDISCPSTANYQFSNVSQLEEDFRNGLFAPAFSVL